MIVDMNITVTAVQLANADRKYLVFPYRWGKLGGGSCTSRLLLKASSKMQGFLSDNVAGSNRSVFESILKTRLKSRRWLHPTRFGCISPSFKWRRCYEHYARELSETCGEKLRFWRTWETPSTDVKTQILALSERCLSSAPKTCKRFHTTENLDNIEQICKGRVDTTTGQYRQAVLGVRTVEKALVRAVKQVIGLKPVLVYWLSLFLQRNLDIAHL